MAEGTRTSALTRCGCGFSTEGPGFYVWDEVASTLQRDAAELWDATASNDRRRAPEPESTPGSD